MAARGHRVAGLASIALVVAAVVASFAYLSVDFRGLWSADFRPLQSPVPLLAIREMTSSDLPFLVGGADHADVYLERYARSIPVHTRRFLVDRLVAADGGRP